MALAICHPCPGNGQKPPPHVARVMHVIGTVGGTSFGEITDVAARPDGGVVVIDGQGIDGPAIIAFDAQGRKEFTLGRVGHGPNEYGRAIGEGDLAVAPDGSILLHDGVNHRIDRWNANGTAEEPLPLPTDPGGPLFPRIVPGRRGDLFVAARVANYASRDLFERRNDGYIHLSATGAVLDTLWPPPALRPMVNSMWAPADSWFPAGDGSVLSFRSDQFGFSRKSASGATHTIPIPMAPTVFARDERTEQLALLHWDAALAPGITTPADLPDTKPFFAMARTDVSGRVVLMLHTRAVRVAPFLAAPGEYRVPPPMLSMVEPPAFALLSTDGAWLDTVTFPIGAQLISFAGNVAWGVVDDDGGTPTLTEWRIN